MTGPLEVVVAVEAEGWSVLPDAEALAERAALAAVAGEEALADGPGPMSVAGRGVSGTAAEISVVLADDALVRQLNRDYRGKDRPTNVLSFPQVGGDGDEGDDPRDDGRGDVGPGENDPEAEALDEDGAGAAPLLLGDVILAFETIEGEARAQGKPLGSHLSHLVVHGVLHLLGYDHESDEDADHMERLETRILAGLGIADPYGDGSRP